jgi:cysteinyl-tRNA synthetase
VLGLATLAGPRGEAVGHGSIDDGSAAGAAHLSAEIERLRDEREDARRRRDFARADELRDALAARGWTVRDTPQGPELVPA